MPLGEDEVGLILSNLMLSHIRSLLVKWSMNFGCSEATGSEDNISLFLKPADDIR